MRRDFYGRINLVFPARHPFPRGGFLQQPLARAFVVRDLGLGARFLGATSVCD